jgi:hypothetical protein
MRAAVRIALLLTFLAALPTLQADGARLDAGGVLNMSRARYAQLVTLYATFEGYSSIAGKRTKIAGWIAFDKGYEGGASGYELEFPGTRRLTIREGDRLRSWVARGAAKLEPAGEQTLKGPVEVPLIPAFGLYDAKKITSNSIVVGAKQTIQVIDAPFERPGDPFIGARLGIEERTWVIRSLQFLDKTNEPAMSFEFKEVHFDEPLPDGIFQPK